MYGNSVPSAQLSVSLKPFLKNSLLIQNKTKNLAKRKSEIEASMENSSKHIRKKSHSFITFFCSKQKKRRKHFPTILSGQHNLDIKLVKDITGKENYRHIFLKDQNQVVARGLGGQKGEMSRWDSEMQSFNTYNWSSNAQDMKSQNKKHHSYPNNKKKRYNLKKSQLLNHQETEILRQSCGLNSKQ